MTFGWVGECAIKNKGRCQIDQADFERQEGHYKEAHIIYGRALAEHPPAELAYYCRQMRGVCSRRVALQRLRLASLNQTLRRQYLAEAAKWLAKSEANLDSAAETAEKSQLAQILLEKAATERAIAKFMRMSGGHNPQRRLSNAARYHEEAMALM